jgi:hypothetical protein
MRDGGLHSMRIRGEPMSEPTAEHLKRAQEFLSEYDALRYSQEIPRLAALLASVEQEARREESGHWQLCLESTYKAERDQARRDLDRKDHECAALKAELAKGWKR